MFWSSDPVPVSAATCDSPGSGTKTDAFVPVIAIDVMLTGGAPVLSVLCPTWLEMRVSGLPVGKLLSEPALLIAYPVPPPGASARYTGFERTCGVDNTVSPEKSTNVNRPGAVVLGAEIATAYFVG